MKSFRENAYQATIVVAVVVDLRLKVLSYCEIDANPVVVEVTRLLRMKVIEVPAAIVAVANS